MHLTAQRENLVGCELSRRTKEQLLVLHGPTVYLLQFTFTTDRQTDGRLMNASTNGPKWSCCMSDNDYPNSSRRLLSFILFYVDAGAKSTELGVCVCE